MMDSLQIDKKMSNEYAVISDRPSMTEPIMQQKNSIYKLFETDPLQFKYLI